MAPAVDSLAATQQFHSELHVEPPLHLSTLQLRQTSWMTKSRTTSKAAALSVVWDADHFEETV